MFLSKLAHTILNVCSQGQVGDVVPAVSFDMVNATRRERRSRLVFLGKFCNISAPLIVQIFGILIYNFGVLFEGEEYYFAKVSVHYLKWIKFYQTLKKALNKM